MFRSLARQSTRAARISPRKRVGAEIDAHPTGHHEIQQIALSERACRGAQPVLLEPRELGETEGEARVVAERAEVAEVIGDAFSSSASARSQAARAGTSALRQALERLAVRPRERDGGVARDARGEPMTFEQLGSSVKRRSMPLCT